jgi:pimeloyl-ACP methyl ester carboxylesterase
MKIKGTSYFQDPEKATIFLEDWATQIQKLNSSWYETMIIHTFLGKTRVWAYNTERKDKEAIVMFPGFRTSSLFWDFDNNLVSLKKKYRLYLIETNGQPNLSEGNSPDIKMPDYGIWATEVLNQLSIRKATIIGASFGAIVCMKLCLVSPAMVNRAFLMNPAGIGTLSLSAVNLYYNFSPIVMKTGGSVQKFIDKIALHPPHHSLSTPYMRLLNEYILFTAKNFNNRADYPQPLKWHELNQIKPGVFLILGGSDRLFSSKKVIAIANEHIRTIIDIKILDDIGHGIEMSKEAIKYIEQVLEESTVITAYE